jgi:predicted ATPase/DNA-binding winged helix-turn-helix (wHTH) protein
MTTEPPVPTPDLRLDTINQCLWRGDTSIPLTPKSFTVLRYLMERPGQLVTKEELLDAAWPGVYVSDAALKVCIRRLRQILGDVTHPPRYIETAHWRGYRFIGRTAGVATFAAGPESRPYEAIPGVATPFREAPHEVQSPSTVPDSVASLPDRPLLIGRDDELRQLKGHLAKAQQGHRALLFVTGPPGIGKTALVEAFLVEAGNDPRVRIARGQCIEHYGVGEPYLPLLEAFNRMCRAPDSDRFLSALHRHAPMWLAQMPSLLTPTERKNVRREVQGSSPERMLREMAEAVEALTTDCTLVLVLDDFHWSDHATFDLLSFLARRRESARFLILGVYRPEEIAPSGHPLKSLKHALHVHQRCEELALASLSTAAIDAYLQERFPRNSFPAKLAALLQRHTGGNPLFLISIVDHLAARGLIVFRDQCWSLESAFEKLQSEIPANLQQMIETQIDKLTLDERRVLEIASVAGLDFSAAAVAAAASVEIADVETICEELTRRGQFLRSHGASEWPDGTVATRYEFMPSFSQQVWYARVTAGRRVQLHQRLGERGERAYGELAPTIAAELAMHFERGRDLQRAVHYRHHAAENAARRFDYREVIKHAARGLELLSTRPLSSERLQQEITLRNMLEAAYMATQGDKEN